jgi:branched-chain amino acid transport system substrate-binding protein
MTRTPLLAAAFAALASAAAAQTACPVKVGAVLPTSIDWGRPIAATAQFAVDLMNQAGGVKGCPVEMILRDDQADPKVGVDAARALVDLDRVPLLLGSVASGVSMPILTSVTVPAGVMQMSCCSSSTAFTRVAAEGKTNGLWFRTFATTRNHAAVAAMLIRDRGFKNVAIFYKNDDWGQDLGRLVAADLAKMGVTVTAQVAITDGQPSYRSEVTSALRTQPEGVYFALYPTEGSSVVREWVSLGGTRKMVVANSLRSDDFRKAVGVEFLADAIGHDSAPPRTDSAKGFVELYTAKFGGAPNGPGLPNMFDAAVISLLAMDAAPELKGAAIAAQVKRVTDPAGTKIFPNTEGLKQAKAVLASGGTVSLQGATGAVSFDQNGDVSAPAVAFGYGPDGAVEKQYFTVEDVNGFIASLK